MEWYERMNKAMDAIEARLDGTVDLEEAAAIVGQSAVSFQRTFSIVTGMSVFEYIRKRRMTLAAFRLQGGEKVIDVAMACGYDSPEAFARAFKEIHGVPPTMARSKGVRLRSFPRITFLLTLKGDAAMDYRIETKEAFSIYGIEEIFTTDDGKNLTDIPAFWERCMDDGRFDRLMKSTHNPDARIHAICQYRETGGSTFPYMLYAYQTKDCDTEGFAVVKVPAATWAIFRTEPHSQAETSGAIQDLIKRVYTDWLPTAGYRKQDGHELEVYFGHGPDQYYEETWIRVEPK